MPRTKRPTATNSSPQGGSKPLLPILGALFGGYGYSPEAKIIPGQEVQGPVEASGAMPRTSDPTKPVLQLNKPTAAQAFFDRGSMSQYNQIKNNFEIGQFEEQQAQANKLAIEAARLQNEQIVAQLKHKLGLDEITARALADRLTKAKGEGFESPEAMIASRQPMNQAKDSFETAKYKDNMQHIPLINRGDAEKQSVLNDKARAETQDTLAQAKMRPILNVGSGDAAVNMDTKDAVYNVRPDASIGQMTGGPVFGPAANRMGGSGTFKPVAGGVNAKITGATSQPAQVNQGQGPMAKPTPAPIIDPYQSYINSIGAPTPQQAIQPIPGVTPTQPPMLNINTQPTPEQAIDIILQREKAKRQNPILNPYNFAAPIY